MSAVVAGTHFGFSRREPRGGFPESWRDIDRAVWRWMCDHGADQATAAAAAWVSQAEGQGHSALPLSLPDGQGATLISTDTRKALEGSPLVACLDAGANEGEPAAVAVRPLVLDGDHLYLLRNHRAEVAVAQALVARRAVTVAAKRPLSDEDLRALFNGSWRDEEARQRDAVRQAVGRRLMVLTGGPGTGKTTTVLRMLLALSREHEAVNDCLPQLRIAAPTGKAAQRLAESLRQGAERLDAGDRALGDVWAPHLDAVLKADAATLHRLLESRGRHGGFRFHAGEPLPADIVVVDEASMLDLAMLRALLAALREDAVLVLVGDADQLTSVGTGSVLMDVVAALESDPRGDLVRLAHCFRADQSLVPINEAVRLGDAVMFADAVAEAGRRQSARGGPCAALHPVADEAALRRRLANWARNLQALFGEVGVDQPVQRDDADALGQRLAVLRRRQLLCALREGPFGALQAADVVAARLRGWEKLAPWPGRWYPGRVVMVTRNDHAARLFNGDVGICLPIDDGQGGSLLQVVFERPPDAAGDAQGAGARLFDPNTLPPHEDAFALTVHKSQGSEYDHVAVLLPPDAESPLLTRQTLYTGLSRARQSVELWSVEASTARAIDTALRRYGRLAERCRM